MTDKADYMRLLPGDSLKAIGRLELLARTPKEGFVTGRHRSPNKGFSVEFAEHRPYSAGDDLRNLDWRVLGRTDRLYVKEFVEETNMRATILVDASGSMGYAGEAAAKRNDRCLTKFEYAQHLAAALTYLLINQQDAVASVDWAKWDEKGIIGLELKDGRRFKLDGWHYAGMRPVADVIRSHQ